MYSAKIQLSSVEQVKDFVNAISDFDFGVDLVSGRYCVNGKSIMGIFSLDLSRPIALQCQAPEEAREAFTKAIAAFVVK